MEVEKTALLLRDFNAGTYLACKYKVVHIVNLSASPIAPHYQIAPAKQTPASFWKRFLPRKLLLDGYSLKGSSSVSATLVFPEYLCTHKNSVLDTAQQAINILRTEIKIV